MKLKQTITFETIIEVDDTIDAEQLRTNLTLTGSTWAEQVLEASPIPLKKTVESGFRVKAEKID